MKYINTYEAFKINIPGDIIDEIKECFLSLSDLIPTDTKTNPGVKVSGITEKEYGSLEGFGRPNDYVRVMVLPKMRSLHEYSEKDESYPNQSFPDLSYTPVDINVEEFCDELISCMNLAEFTGFKINCAIIAYSNGGQFGGVGEVIKKFKYNGVDPEGIDTKNYSTRTTNSYDIEKLEWFLKEEVKDRLRWIKIFYS